MCNTRPRELTLAAQQSVVLKDVVATLFESPDSSGGLEILTSGPWLVATSRMNSRAPRGTFGTEIPALRDSQFAASTLFSGIRNSADFRTNLGVFNPQDYPVTVVVALFVDGKQSAEESIEIAPRTLVQVSAFRFLGRQDVITDNAYLRVTTTFSSVITFVSVIDNATNDVAYSTGVKQL